MLRRTALLWAATAPLLPACGDDPEPCRRGLATCPGARAPTWSLVDVQPASPWFGQRHGLEVFHGRTTVLVMVDTSCGSCGPVAKAYDAMGRELSAEGVDVALCGLVPLFDAPAIVELIGALTFPLLVDEPGIDAWGEMGAGPSDAFVYGRSGLLLDHLAVDDPTRGPMFPGVPAGYARVKQALTRAAAIDAPTFTSAR